MYVDTISWDANSLKDALGLTFDEVYEFFTDGRKVAFLLEKRLFKRFGEKEAKSGSPFDFITPDDAKVEVRVVTRHGVFFCPCSMKGSGRHFDAEKFKEKLLQVDFYLLADLTTFPDTQFIAVPSSCIYDAWINGKLGPTTSISYIKCRKLFFKDHIDEEIMEQIEEISGNQI